MDINHKAPQDFSKTTQPHYIVFLGASWKCFERTACVQLNQDIAKFRSRLLFFWLHFPDVQAPDDSP